MLAGTLPSVTARSAIGRTLIVALAVLLAGSVSRLLADAVAEMPCGPNAVPVTGKEMVAFAPAARSPIGQMIVDPLVEQTPPALPEVVSPAGNEMASCAFNAP